MVTYAGALVDVTGAGCHDNGGANNQKVWFENVLHGPRPTFLRH